VKKLFAIAFLALAVAAAAFAQQKYALVIGNGAYTSITKLNNPVNDANDVAAALQALGFTVEKLLNASQDQMESGAIRLKNRLSAAKNSYGLLFYAGHGVQSNGENYLIPVDANIQSESFLRQRAVSVQAMLDELNDAGNELNVVVLDACRDNPFSWKRSGSRGLSVVGQQPADSIIVFATSAGSTAADGTSRNGLFTSHFLTHLKTPGLEVSEVFRLTMGDVARASNNQQRPAVYNQFAGLAYLNSRPVASPAPVIATPPPQATRAPVQPPPAPTVQSATTTPAATTPAAVTTTTDNVIFWENNGHSYLLVDKVQSWTSAKSEAERRGGYLAVITSEEEQRFIMQLIQKHGNKMKYWLGGYRKGTWQWVTGESFSYKNWGPGQPDNSSGQQDKLVINQGGNWDDVNPYNSNDPSIGYIIEWDTK